MRAARAAAGADKCPKCRNTGLILAGDKASGWQVATCIDCPHGIAREAVALAREEMGAALVGHLFDDGLRLRRMEFEKNKRYVEFKEWLKQTIDEYTPPSR